jgi:hypothetical protein
VKQFSLPRYLVSRQDEIVSQGSQELSVLQRLPIRAWITIGNLVIAAVIFAVALAAGHAQVVSIVEASDPALADADSESSVTEVVAIPQM